MKKIIKRKNSSVPQRDEQDMAAVINKMQGQLVSLEKKIDALLLRSQERPLAEKHFSKPFRPFDHSRHHGKGDRDNNFRERNFTKVICSDCKKECEVPFKPSGDRPVYCKECFSKRKDNRDPIREQVFNPERHFDKHKNSENRKPGKRKQSGFRKRK